MSWWCPSRRNIHLFRLRPRLQRGGEATDVPKPCASRAHRSFHLPSASPSITPYERNNISNSHISSRKARPRNMDIVVELTVQGEVRSFVLQVRIPHATMIGSASSIHSVEKSERRKKWHT